MYYYRFTFWKAAFSFQQRWRKWKWKLIIMLSLWKYYFVCCIMLNWQCKETPEESWKGFLQNCSESIQWKRCYSLEYILHKVKVLSSNCTSFIVSQSIYYVFKHVARSEKRICNLWLCIQTMFLEYLRKRLCISTAFYYPQGANNFFLLCSDFLVLRDLTKLQVYLPMIPKLSGI